MGPAQPPGGRRFGPVGRAGDFWIPLRFPGDAVSVPYDREQRDSNHLSREEERESESRRMPNETQITSHQVVGLSGERTNVVAISRLIRECCDAGLLREEDEESSDEFRRYIPAWA